MELYQKILIIVGYIIMMFLTAFLLNKLTKYDKSECIGWALIWPFIPVYVITYVVPVLVLVKGIEWLADKWKDWEYNHKK